MPCIFIAIHLTFVGYQIWKLIENILKASFFPSETERRIYIHILFLQYRSE